MKVLDTQKNDKFLLMKVEVDKTLWETEQDKTKKGLAKNVKIDGFRKGKVPLEKALKMIDPSLVIEKAINKVLPKVADEVFKSKEYEDNADNLFDLPPKVEVHTITTDSLELVFNFYLIPTVTVENYKNLKIEVEKAEAKNEEVEKVIADYLNKEAMMVPKDGPAEMGDHVIFDFVGFVDKKAFKGGEAKNYDLELGSKAFIPGFEEQMVGLKAKDAKTVVVTFPKDYHEKTLAGKEAEFEVMVHSVTKLEKPELNDEFVKSLNLEKVETVDQFKKYCKDNIIKQKESQAENKAKQDFLNELYKLVKLNYEPQEVIEREAQRIRAEMERQVKMFGVDLKTYCQILNMNEETLKQKELEQARMNVYNTLGMDKLIEDLKIEVTEKEIEDKIAFFAKHDNVSVEDIKKQLNNDNDIIESLILQEKLIEKFIVRK